MDFTKEQKERYSRHITLKELGEEGQKKICNSKILVIGAGGLGSPALFYLAASGVGTLGIVDGDVVDYSNLQRQILHRTKDLGREKTESAKETITNLNPDVNVVLYKERVYANNIEKIIKDYDFIIEATDNFQAKFLINDACYLNNKPFSHAGVLKFYGQTITHTPGNACYRCIFDNPPPKGAVPTCGEAGLISVVPGVLGVIQATEALKYVLGHGELLTNSLLTYDSEKLFFRTIKINRNPKCILCGDKPKIKELIDQVETD